MKETNNNKAVKLRICVISAKTFIKFQCYNNTSIKSSKSAKTLLKLNKKSLKPGAINSRANLKSDRDYQWNKQIIKPEIIYIVK